jgi:hypothetical protein
VTVGSVMQPGEGSGLVPGALWGLIKNAHACMQGSRVRTFGRPSDDAPKRQAVTLTRSETPEGLQIASQRPAWRQKIAALCTADVGHRPGNYCTGKAPDLPTVSALALQHWLGSRESTNNAARPIQPASRPLPLGTHAAACLRHACCCRPLVEWCLQVWVERDGRV